MKKTLLLLLSCCLIFACLLTSCPSNPETKHTHSYAVQDDGTLKCTGCAAKVTTPYVAVLKDENSKSVSSYEALTESNYSNNRIETLAIYTTTGNYVIDAPECTVKHYGSADSIIINGVAMNSYHEKGAVASITIKKGRIVIESDSVGTMIVEPDFSESQINIEIPKDIVLPLVSISNENPDVTVNLQINGEGEISNLSIEKSNVTIETSSTDIDDIIKMFSRSSEDLANITVKQNNETKTVEYHHTHTSNGNWRNDSEYHWITCADADCGATYGKAPHTIVPVEDGESIKYICAECGYCLLTKARTIPADLLNKMVSSLMTDGAAISDAIENFDIYKEFFEHLTNEEEGYSLSLKSGSAKGETVGKIESTFSSDVGILGNLTIELTGVRKDEESETFCYTVDSATYEIEDSFFDEDLEGEEIENFCGLNGKSFPSADPLEYSVLRQIIESRLYEAYQSDKLGEEMTISLEDLYIFPFVEYALDSYSINLTGTEAVDSFSISKCNLNYCYAYDYYCYPYTLMEDYKELVGKAVEMTSDMLEEIPTLEINEETFEDDDEAVYDLLSEIRNVALTNCEFIAENAVISMETPENTAEAAVNGKITLNQIIEAPTSETDSDGCFTIKTPEAMTISIDSLTAKIKDTALNLSLAVSNVKAAHETTYITKYPEPSEDLNNLDDNEDDGNVMSKMETQESHRITADSITVTGIFAQTTAVTDKIEIALSNAEIAYTSLIGDETYNASCAVKGTVSILLDCGGEKLSYRTDINCPDLAEEPEINGLEDVIQYLGMTNRSASVNGSAVDIADFETELISFVMGNLPMLLGEI